MSHGGVSFQCGIDEVTVGTGEILISWYNPWMERRATFSNTFEKAYQDSPDGSGGLDGSRDGNAWMEGGISHTQQFCILWGLVLPVR